MKRSLNPQSAIRNPQSRAAISLTEVLIAMGILTLGLLGVAALFPVGSYYMQRAEISDRGAQIGRAAMGQLVTSGMLDARGWRTLAVQPPSTPALPLATDAAANTFLRPFLPVLSEALAKTAALPPNARQQNLARLFGHVFVIDPMAVSTASIPGATMGTLNRPAGVFPATAFRPPAGLSYTNGWTPWWWGSNPNQYTWPIRRITFPHPGAATLNMPPTVAEHYFRGRDDLATDLPDRDDRPAAQNWDIDNSSGAPLARQWAGDYSWIATVVPSTNAARDAMATNPESHAYDVSVVVFYKRVLSAGAPQSQPELAQAADTLLQSELYARATIVSTGLTGGEVLLEKPVGPGTIDPFPQLKAGQWIALCGPHPNSSASEPRFVMKWYQVMSIDIEGNGISGFNPTNNRVVTLRGPQWPWLPGQPISNNLCACIVRGAVAVHTKTLRLEGPRSSAFGGGGASTGGPGPIGAGLR